MDLHPGVLVDGRYELVECLGTGAMGQVWRALDTRFESRTVAVKFLREEETFDEDAARRSRLLARLEAQTASGAMSVQSAVDALASALAVSDTAPLRARVDAKLQTAPLNAATIAAVFDELSRDPAFNENARMRAKLRRLFRDEANAVANLRHDNIVSIFDYGEHERTPYLVMDFIDGRTLQQVIEDGVSLGLTRRLRLIEDLCEGLAFAHSRKLVHRDIKPANLIIDHATESLKILDFGVVRRLGSESTVGVPVGTFCYMSPEQTRGAATLDHRSDVFAVGLVLYELITGRKAFPPGRGIGDLIARIQREPPAPMNALTPGLPNRIHEIVDKAIAKRPEDRYQDLRDLARDLSRVRTQLETEDQAERTMVLKPSDLPATIVATRASDVHELPSLKVPAFAAQPTVAIPTPVVAAPPPLKSVQSQAPTAAENAPPPPTVDSSPPVPAPSGRQGMSPRTVVAAIAAMVIVAAVVFAIAFTITRWQISGPESAAAPIANPTPTAAQQESTSGAQVEPTASAPVASSTPAVAPAVVSIDIRPWARVRITPGAGAKVDPAILAEPRYTPFSVDLPPGDYTLECENGGLTAPATFQLQVAADEGRAQTFTRTMPGFNAARVVEMLLRND